MKHPAFPSMQEVEAANREQLARWFRFLPVGRNEVQFAINSRIFDRFKELGMFTPELSKKVGWKE